jgi:hypothetical protein
MRSYKMTLYIDKLEDSEFDGLKEFIDEILDSAVDITFFKNLDELESSFRQDLVAGEPEEDFLTRIAKPIWLRLKRYTPVGLNVIDLDSPVWDTFKEGEDTSYFESASSVHYKTSENMFTMDGV